MERGRTLVYPEKTAQCFLCVFCPLDSSTTALSLNPALGGSQEFRVPRAHHGGPASPQSSSPAPTQRGSLHHCFSEETVGSEPGVAAYTRLAPCRSASGMSLLDWAPTEGSKWTVPWHAVAVDSPQWSSGPA